MAGTIRTLSSIVLTYYSKFYTAFIITGNSIAEYIMKSFNVKSAEQA